ncbi:MAG: hypothetical protein C0519_14385 [Hyphomicrobium sp.]|nr:hypothetical protein [Hyphomicrobium sp.]PPD07896.1 MAG: hypothetical protein CTY28_06300 [Hyphomicrobium sp.]
MPRLYKFALLGFTAYALATASPAQQSEIGQGLLAIKDAAVDACTIEGRLCTRAIDYALSALNSTLSDDPAPWMDEQSKRVQPPPQTTPPRNAG